jgi:arylformamidase
LITHRIRDFDDAYANGPHIPDGASWPGRWQEKAAPWRDAMAAAGRARLDLAYGERPRNRLDLFLPEGEARGLVVFVHGGYWMRLDKSVWSHLAAGPLAHGHAVAMPSYTLCPDIRIAGITAEIGMAIEKAAGEVAGPIRLAGHSAGGHLVSRMMSLTSPLSPATLARVANTVSISGVHDLRPLLRTAMNGTLGLDEAEAATESPALLRPAANARLCCFVGAAERAEFVRQNALLANIWLGLGAETAAHAEPDTHHFTVVDGLGDPDSALTRTLLTGRVPDPTFSSIEQAKSRP